ncbi:MAG: alpha/beta hydrolase [Nevskiaceae bacterium]|nr:MAG: alpha/beta hydrolase [Nevskiaceae bacterium]TBR71518.1 MAG: alpha/beta hydrolase [Nevskiaceae bacterium]
MTTPIPVKPGLAWPHDLRGCAQLGFDAVVATTDIVEAMHASIVRAPWPWQRLKAHRTHGITGFVYGCVRGVTRVVAESTDLTLSGLVPLVEHVVAEGEPGFARDAWVAVANGVVGDHLQATGNPLAQPMQWKVGDSPVGLNNEAETRASIAKVLSALPASRRGRLLVLMHGLCMNEREWRQRDGYDFGADLAARLDAIPVYLRYNSGLHVSTNGRQVAAQLQLLLDAWPAPVESLHILGFSMGGLVARSAYRYAHIDSREWPARLQTMIFVGTPHNGAPLERGGNWFQTSAGWVPYTAPLARLGMLRSAGITDLRYGNLLDEDWSDGDRFARNDDSRQPVPLPAGVRCLAVAATLGACRGDAKDRALGDGLVPVASALGEPASLGYGLQIAGNDQAVFCRTGHLGLIARHDVAPWVGRRLGCAA